MAFEGLTEKLSAAFKKLRGKGRLSEADVKEAMREIRLALLEADVSYKVVKDFIKKTTERAVGGCAGESDPGTDDRQDRQRGANRPHGQRQPENPHGVPAADHRDAGGLAGRRQNDQRRKAGGAVQKAEQKTAARRL